LVYSYLRGKMLIAQDGINEGSEAEVYGWVLSIREQKTLSFVIVYENRKQVQIVIKDKKLMTSQLKQNSVIWAKGTIKITDKAPNGFEIHVRSLKVLSKPKKLPPFNIMSTDIPALDLRLDYRALDLRRPYNINLFTLRSKTLQYFREYLTSKNFLEVQTPKIIATASEGGAALFPLMYYDKQAFLAQSPQLYKEELTMSFERVFEIGPIFRAEPSRTLKHLSEAISLDVEAAFLKNDDLMNLLEDMIKYVLNKLYEKDGETVKKIKAPLLDISKKFPRYSYSDVVKWINKNVEELQEGEDLSSKHLEAFGENVGGFYFIKDWPLKLKPFYIQPLDKDYSSSFDLMYKGLELSSGGERVHDPTLLRKGLKRTGLSAKGFKYHLEVYNYGMPPHGGFGLGVDRFMMVVTGAENIREVVLYPRDVRRLVP
ncbi:MAG: aspartate--tRNA(Asn) ligase, partial [Nitrososphaeria archaeon]